MRIPLDLYCYPVRPDGKRVPASVEAVVEVPDVAAGEAHVAAVLRFGDRPETVWRAWNGVLYAPHVSRTGHDEGPCETLRRKRLGGGCLLTLNADEPARQDARYRDDVKRVEDPFSQPPALKALRNARAAAALYLVVDGELWQRHPGPVLLPSEYEPGVAETLSEIGRPSFRHAYAVSAATGWNEAVAALREIVGGIAVPPATLRVEIPEALRAFDDTAFAFEQAAQRALSDLGDVPAEKGSSAFIKAYARLRRVMRDGRELTGYPTVSTVSPNDVRLFEFEVPDDAASMISDLAAASDGLLSKREIRALETVASRCAAREPRLDPGDEAALAAMEGRAP